MRIGPHTRAALVDDMWSAARREAESAAGLLRPGVPLRESCCLIYALPGCVECAGCPRLRPESWLTASVRRGIGCRSVAAGGLRTQPVPVQR